MVDPVMDVEKIDYVSVGQSIVYVARGAGENKGKRDGFCKGELVCYQDVDKGTDDEKGEDGKHVPSRFMASEEAKGPAEIPRMNDRDERPDFNAPKVRDVICDENLRPPVEKKNSRDYKEDKVSAHLLHTFGN